MPQGFDGSSEVFQTRQEDCYCRRLTLAGGREWEVNQTDGSESGSLDGCAERAGCHCFLSTVWLFGRCEQLALAPVGVGAV